MAGGILPPLEVIASWPTPNYVNPVQKGWGLVIAAIILSTLSTSIVCARLWARIKLRNMGIDDWIIIITMFPALGMSVLICLASRMFGFDRHLWDNMLATSLKGRKIVMAIEALYVISTGLTKVSILLFYRRLVSGTFSRVFVWTVRATIFSVFAYMLTFELTLIFGCRPIHAYWDQVNPIWRGLNEYKCLNEVATLYSANITSIVQDFLTFLMPLLLFWKLQLPVRQKVILGGIFSIGFFICIIGIIRIVYTENIYFKTYDVTWESEPLWYWTVAELHGAIMCASAPALKVFFKRFLRSNTTRGGGTPAHKPGYDNGAKPRDAEKGAVEYSGTDTSFSFGSGSRMGESTVSTFIGGGSTIDYETAAWEEKPGGEGWSGWNVKHGGVNVGRTVESYTTPNAVMVPLRKPGSGTLVTVPSRHY